MNHLVIIVACHYAVVEAPVAERAELEEVSNSATSTLQPDITHICARIEALPSYVLCRVSLKCMHRW